MGETGTWPVKRRLTAATILSSLSGFGLEMCAQQNESPPNAMDSYSVAVYSPGPAFLDLQRLMVYPFRGKPIAIPLPFALSRLTFGPSGEAIYAGAMIAPRRPPKPGIFKVEFNPVRATSVPGSLELGAASMVVSKRQDKIVISGGHGRGSDAVCGIFELSLTNGNLRQVLQESNCSYTGSWLYLTLSPDGVQAVGIREHRLGVIHLSDGATRFLGYGYDMAAWSPDGKWIAALESSGKERTIIFDASDFSQHRTLEASDVIWSPDSRYLLVWKAHAVCGAYLGTLETMDVETGKRLPIESSRCQVSESAVGWVSNQVLQGLGGSSKSPR